MDLNITAENSKAYQLLNSFFILESVTRKKWAIAMLSRSNLDDWIVINFGFIRCKKNILILFEL